jgi:hypothetical protein
VVTWVFLVLQSALAGELVVNVEGGGAAACAVSVDGQAKGNTPLHLTGLAAGSHSFSFTCLDRDPFTEQRDVADQPNGFQQLTFKAPPPKMVTTPVDVYLVVRDLTRGEKVRIDGGDPVSIPYHAKLVPGMHDFLVLDRAGNEARHLQREVLGNPAGVVLKLE